MNFGTLIRRSLGFHWRSHLGVVLGAAVSSATLVGALIVGDSVRESLRERALVRLRGAEHALAGGDRLFRAELGSDLGRGAQVATETLLELRGIATSQDGTARANAVHIYGTAAGKSGTEVQDGTVHLNEALAAHLHAKTGDSVLLRFEKPSALSRDAVITPQSERTVTLRLKVARIVPATDGGDFDLRVSQLPPFNAFVNSAELGKAAGIAGKANVILAKMTSGEGQATTVESLSEELRRRWTLDDAQISVHPLSNNAVEVSTPRIFLDDATVKAATNSVANAAPLLTYLVNLVRAGTNAVPYSMVTAAGQPYTPADLREDEIVVNRWLADELHVAAGDTVSLTYFIADQVSDLKERTNAFRVRSIVPLEGVYADRTLMPEFPGLAKAESTHDWDAGFPLVHKIRAQDEAYWKQHRGTPKAFISLAAGQALWANRFGALTAVRWPVQGTQATTQLVAAVQQNLLHQLDPKDLGLAFRPVREDALRAAAQSQDFGGLFIGFSLFLIVAAITLTALLFQFGVEQRAAEIGTLLAIGFQPKRVRTLFLLEGAALAVIGGALGAALGTIYARLMLRGLTTVWRSATNTSTLTFHAAPETVLTGAACGVAVAIITIWFVLRKQGRQSARALLSGAVDSAPERARRTRGWTQWIRFAFRAPVLAWASLVLAIATIAAAFATGQSTNPEYFFSAGSFCLISGLAFTSLLLGKLLTRESRRHLTTGSLAMRGAARRRNRSVATVTLLACGVFLIAAIGAFRLDANQNAWRRSSGTGGFALVAESTLPVLKDLNTREGRDALGLDEKILRDVRIVPLRVKEGDDASCLNLNRAQQPRLLGVDPASLSGCFTFAKAPDVHASSGLNETNPWAALSLRGHSFATSVKSPSLADSAVPAIGDAASIQWALGKKIGDLLSFTDERGNAFPVRLVGGLANSIMQGSLLVSEAELTRAFPGISGYRMFLIDCPSNAVPEVSAELTRALQDYGLEVTPAAERLAAFNAVQNTYLSTFQVLGGLGLLLGSLGLGIVVLRNVLERRGELALLLAVGLRRALVHRLVLLEHLALLCLGLGVGIVSAVIAVLPGISTPNAGLPVASLAATLAGVVLFGLLSTWLATRAAIRGNLLEGLRNE